MGHLTVAEVRYLIDALTLDDQTRQALEHLRVQVAEQLSDDQIDALRDACGERLQVAGFDENYAATTEGAALEDLIDRLFLG